MVYAWSQNFKCGFSCKINSWNLEFTKRNWMGSLTCCGVDNFKVSFFASWQHGLDYYYCEKWLDDPHANQNLDYYYCKEFAWQSICQLQAKFKLQTILDNIKTFSKG